MSELSTHVLDTALGRPASGVRVRLENPEGAVVGRGSTDADGRLDRIGPEHLDAGTYRLHFDTGAYFATSGQSGFYPEVVVTVELSDPEGHYHVPLLLSPFAYSTYRGS